MLATLGMVRPTMRAWAGLPSATAPHPHKCPSRHGMLPQDPHLLAPQPVSFARKPAKTQEDVVRRRELARVADELRSVLALRGPAGKGNFSGAAGKAPGKSLSGGGGRLTALAAKPPGSSGSDGSSSSSSSSEAS